MKIVPAILAERENDFFPLAKQAEAFTGFIQIDILDGFFIPSRSFFICTEQAQYKHGLRNTLKGKVMK